MASNTTLYLDLPPLPSYTLTPRESLVPHIPDNLFSLMLPIIAYWTVSLIFHFIDVNDFFPQYRLHTPAELLKRNHVSRTDVVRDVVVQQIIQTIVGLALTFFDEAECVGREQYDVAVWARRLRIAQRVIPHFLGLVGVDSLGLAEKFSTNASLSGFLAGGHYPDLVQSLVLDNGLEVMAPAFAQWELAVASFIYWYLIPAFQFILAIFILDTWQYFWHRAMHLNRWLYVTFHSRHHRLYVPYAFGALYNHPFEGFLLDTAGTGVAFLVSRMTIRQSMWFFTFSTIKTVDDHCGYAFPWDPLQLVTNNNSAYHDIHHQSWGIKTNFSQPFFTIWDRFMGTQWVGDVSLKYERTRAAAEKQVEFDKQGLSADATVAEPDPLAAGFPDQDRPESSPSRKAAKLELRSNASVRSRRTDSLKGLGHGVNGSIRQK